MLMRLPKYRSKTDKESLIMLADSLSYAFLLNTGEALQEQLSQ